MGMGACHWMPLEKSREAEGPVTATGEQDKKGPERAGQGMLVLGCRSASWQLSSLRELASQWGAEGRPGPPSSQGPASRSCPRVGQANSEASAFLPVGTEKPVIGSAEPTEEPSH